MLRHQLTVFVARPQDPPSAMTTGLCSARSLPRSPALNAPVGSSPLKHCCAGTDDASLVTGHSPCEDRASIDRNREPPAHPPPRRREPDLVLPTHPRRTHRTRPPHCLLHRLADPQSQRHRPSTRTIRTHLVAVPALPSRCRLRLLHRRHRHTPPVLRPALHPHPPPDKFSTPASPPTPPGPGPPRPPATSSSATPTRSQIHGRWCETGEANSYTPSTRSSAPKASRSSKPPSVHPSPTLSLNAGSTRSAANSSTYTCPRI